MADWRELTELLSSAPSSREEVEGWRRLWRPILVLVALVGIAAVTPSWGGVAVVAASLPVILIAAWSSGLRWTLWFSIVAAVAPGLMTAWDPAETPIGMLGRLLIYFGPALLVVLLRTALDRTTQIAEHDKLTGLLNRTGFLRRLESESNRAARSGWPIAVGFLDCDNFKEVNDQQGHLAGDEVLRTVGASIADNIRNYDAAARFGGDEFVMLWPVLSAKGGEDAARRLHTRLTERMVASNLPITFSLGVAVFEEIPDTDEILRLADALMYDVKRTEKGTLRVATYGRRAVS